MNPIIQILGLVIFGIGTFWDKVEGNKKELTNDIEPDSIAPTPVASIVPTVENVPTSAIEDLSE